MEMKWFAIMVAVMFSAMFAGLAFEKYTENQCKIAFAGSNHTAEEIAKVCGKGRL
jgi:hypothetical protein